MLAWERVIARRDGGGEDWEECKPFRQASRWPKEVASARGGLCRTIVGVRRGIEETNSTEESGQDKGAKRTVGQYDKLSIRKVADTGYSREEGERRHEGGGQKERGHTCYRVHV